MIEQIFTNHLNPSQTEFLYELDLIKKNAKVEADEWVRNTRPVISLDECLQSGYINQKQARIIPNQGMPFPDTVYTITEKGTDYLKKIDSDLTGEPLIIQTGKSWKVVKVLQMIDQVDSDGRLNAFVYEAADGTGGRAQTNQILSEVDIRDANNLLRLASQYAESQREIERKAEAAAERIAALEAKAKRNEKLTQVLSWIGIRRTEPWMDYEIIDGVYIQLADDAEIDDAFTIYDLVVSHSSDPNSYPFYAMQVEEAGPTDYQYRVNTLAELAEAIQGIKGKTAPEPEDTQTSIQKPEPDTNVKILHFTVSNKNKRGEAERNIAELINSGWTMIHSSTNHWPGGGETKGTAIFHKQSVDTGNDDPDLSIIIPDAPPATSVISETSIAGTTEHIEANRQVWHHASKSGLFAPEQMQRISDAVTLINSISKSLGQNQNVILS